MNRRHSPTKEVDLRAVEYVRMSTDHQKYSIENQSAAIHEYADAHSIRILRPYIDSGKSGLTLTKRDGLKNLLQTVLAGTADFNTVLVYDVSRWGRFQDVDESAYYEYMLKRAGVRVIYCAESFHDSGGPMDALIKTLKRAMAAEFSRDLSVKVSAGQRRNAQLGYRNGGLAGFGFLRVAIEPGGSRRIVLRDGERKGIKTDRVTLIRGPKSEIRTIREIFELFVNHGFTERAIANHLNEKGAFTRKGNPWSKETIRHLLVNPKYVGDLAYSRTVTHMGSLAVPNLRENWTYVSDGYPQLVSRELWNRSQEIFKKRAESHTKEEMLVRLRALLKKHGRLTYNLIDGEPGMMSAQTYLHRFGSIAEAYRHVGWQGRQREPETKRKPEAIACRYALEQAVTERIAGSADEFVKDAKFPLWKVNNELAIYVAFVVATKNTERRIFWRLHWRPQYYTGGDPDFLVIARLNLEANAIIDYYVYPGSWPTTIRIYEQNAWAVEAHRCEDLGFLDLICRRTRLSAEGQSHA